MQYIMTRDSKNHQVRSHGLTERQMLGQSSPVFFNPCGECGSVLSGMLADIDGFIVTDEDLRRGYIFRDHPDARKLYKIDGEL